METTANNGFSGGVENFPRFLEDWTGNTFTYNGSMVVLFDSRIATDSYVQTGYSLNSYVAPTRNWNF